MELRRITWAATIHLAIVLSVTATFAALALAEAGVPRPTIVLTVIVVGFVASWVRTGQVARSHARPRSHRIATVPLQGVGHPVG